LVRVGFILSFHKEKGFSSIQTLISFSVVVLLVMTIVPSIILIKREQAVLQTRLFAAHQIHNGLVEELALDTMDPRTMETDLITYTIDYQGNQVEVCGQWINPKQVEEKRCYYGKK